MDLPTQITNTSRGIRKYSIVRANPVSSSTVGRHPNTAPASVISGHLCSGSSSGKGRCTIRERDPATVRRYADEGFDNVLIWTDQVWPAVGTLEEKRTSLFAAAATLGLR